MRGYVGQRGGAKGLLLWEMENDQGILRRGFDETG